MGRKPGNKNTFNVDDVGYSTFMLVAPLLVLSLQRAQVLEPSKDSVL